MNPFIISKKRSGMENWANNYYRDPLPVLSNDKIWIHESEIINQNKQERFIAFILAIGLECDMPILEAFYFRNQPVLISEANPDILLNRLAYRIGIFIQGKILARDGWKTKSSIHGDNRIVYKNGCLFYWTALLNTKAVNFYIQLPGDIVYLRIQITMKNQKIRFRKYGHSTMRFLKGSHILERQEKQLLQKRNISSQFENLILECCAICESNRMREDIEYVHNVSKKPLGFEAGDAIFIDEFSFVPAFEEGTGVMFTPPVYGQLDTTGLMPNQKFAQELGEYIKTLSDFEPIQSRRTGKTTGVVSSVVEILKTKCKLCIQPGPQMCSRCKKIRYCSVDCQRKDWPRHKSECTPIKI